jgi:hypothetical protein
MKKVIAIIALLVGSITPAYADNTFGAPVVVSQQLVNCEVPNLRCDGVTVVFDVPANSGFNADTMKFLALKVGSQAVGISNGQSGIVVSGLPLDTYVNAYVTYSVANGCCWVNQNGASNSFKTLAINKIVIPEPVSVTPTPVITLQDKKLQDVIDAENANQPTKVITSTTATVTPETITATTVTTETTTATITSVTIETLYEKILALFTQLLALIAKLNG